MTFIHSSFDEYVQAVESALPEQLSTVTGELTSQETDGWYTPVSYTHLDVYKRQGIGLVGLEKDYPQPVDN